MIDKLQLGVAIAALLISIRRGDDNLMFASLLMVASVLLVIPSDGTLFPVVMLSALQLGLGFLTMKLCGSVHGIVQCSLVCCHLVINITLCADVIFSLNMVYDNYLAYSNFITFMQCLALLVVGGACATGGSLYNNKCRSAISSVNSVHSKSD